MFHTQLQPQLKVKLGYELRLKLEFQNRCLKHPNGLLIPLVLIYSGEQETVQVEFSERWLQSLIGWKSDQEWKSDQDVSRLLAWYK